MDLTHALRELGQLFEKLDLTYAVMGGIAVRAYGIPRPTYDIDFTIAIERAELVNLYREVTKLGYSVPEPHTSGWVVTVAGMPLVKFRHYVAEKNVDIDVFLAERLFQHELLKRRRRERVDDVPVWLVTPEDLILLKLLANRPRDVADIGDVLFTQGDLDPAYMRQWAKELGVLSELDRILSELPAP